MALLCLALTFFAAGAALAEGTGYYNINIGWDSEAENFPGNVVVSPAYAAAGDPVHLLVEESLSFMQSLTVTYTDGDGSLKTVRTLQDADDPDLYSFTMPGAEVDVFASFGSGETPHSVTIAEGIEHGRITSNRHTVCQGNIVTLTVIPDAGYMLADIAVAPMREAQARPVRANPSDSSAALPPLPPRGTAAVRTFKGKAGLVHELFIHAFSLSQGE